MDKRTRNILLIVVGALLLLCCYCLVATGIGTYLLSRSTQSELQPEPITTPAVTKAVPTQHATSAVLPPADKTPQAPAEEPTLAVTEQPGTEQPGTGPAPSSALPIPTLDAEAQALLESEVPAADARELALQFEADGAEIPITVNPTAPVYAVGDKAEFWISNSDTQEHKQITAVLKVLTDHVAMWVEQGVRLNQSDLQASARRFEEKTYPTNREFFGSEWTPGIDNDVRLHILHARGLGETVAGYYSSADEYSRQVNEYSNEREMFYVSADSGSAKPNSDFYDGTLAHEFQHMIHWANDRNETSWVNEGMSELASYLNGFDAGGADYAYMMKPDTQLTTWADPSEASVTEHYGASYLFTTYFLDRFGEELTQAVVASPKNGIAGYNAALAAAGQPERFDDIFADWVIANYLDEPQADTNGRFGYSNIDLADIAVSETHRSYPASAEAQVSQYGADYIQLKGRGAITIDFAGQAETPVTNAVPQGAYSWWSNRGDQSNATLARAFDLRDLTSATLTFSAWYDIEEGWDYAYVAASTDGGQRWQILNGLHTTNENPVGNAFGPGWTGISGNGDIPEWVDERIDLTPFAGQQILLRFQVVTDDAVNHAGMLIDNIAIPELGFTDDSEAGPDGWEASGWILTDNAVAQRWLVQLISVDGNNITVQRMPVGADGRGQLTLNNLGGLDDAVLVISALAPVTTEAASYSYEITQP